MKKITFLTFALIFSFIGNAQISIADENGDEITDGKEFTYTTLGQTTAELGIKITNNSSSTVYVLGEVVSMENASGQNLQFCLGDTCYATISEGTSYPLGNPVTLDQGESNGNFDHFFNNYAGNNTNNPVKYAFRFYEVDANGNEIGDLVSFSYTYDSSLSSSTYSLENLGVVLNSSIITNDISFSTKENVTINVYDLNGKQIKSQNFAHGAHNLNASQLNTGVYLVKFNTLNGKQATTKIIKK